MVDVCFLIPFVLPSEQLQQRALSVLYSHVTICRDCMDIPSQNRQQMGDGQQPARHTASAMNSSKEELLECTDVSFVRPH